MGDVLILDDVHAHARLTELCLFTCGVCVCVGQSRRAPSRWLPVNPIAVVVVVAEIVTFRGPSFKSSWSARHGRQRCRFDAGEQSQSNTKRNSGESFARDTLWRDTAFSKPVDRLPYKKNVTFSSGQMYPLRKTLTVQQRCFVCLISDVPTVEIFVATETTSSK